MASPTRAAPPLGLPLKISYGLGSVAYGVGAIGLSGGLLQLYFNQVLGLPAVWVGAVIMATIMVDAVIDPLIGRWSDHLRSPLGRRHTLMYASAIPTAVAFALLWAAPEGLEPPLLLAYMAVTLIFSRVAISFYEIPSTALAPELAPDPHTRTSLFAWRIFFLVAGGAVMSLILYQVFLPQDAANPQGVLNRDGYAGFGLAIGVVSLVVILISTAATHRRIRTLHTPPVERTSLRQLIEEGRAILSHRPLVLIIAAAALAGVAGGTFDGLSMYFNLHFWELSPQVIGLVWAWGSLAAVMALAVGPRVARRFGRVRTVVALWLIWLATAIVPPILRLAGLFPENGSPALVPTLIVNFLIGVTCLLSNMAVVGSMVSDAVDAIAEKTGRRSEGLTFALKGVLDKWALAVGAFAAGAIVSFVDFPVRAQPGTVDPAVVNQLAYIYIPLAVVANLTAVFLFSRLAGASEARGRVSTAQAAETTAAAAP